MSSLAPAVVHFARPYKEAGVTILSAASKSLMERQFYSCLSQFTGGAAAKTIQIAIPFFNQKHRNIFSSICQRDFHVVIEDFRKSQKNYMKTVKVNLQQNPVQLLTLHAENYFSKAGLRSVCQLIETISSEVGQVLFVAATPVLVPATPIGALSAYTMVRLIAGYVTTEVLEEPDLSIEMDDLKKKKERIHEGWVDLADELCENPSP